MGSVGHRHRKGSMNYDGMKIAARKDELKPVSAGESSVEPGSVKLDDDRAERYCVKVSEGIDPLEAWQMAYRDEEGIPRLKKSSANAGRWRVGYKPEVLERIRFLSSKGVVESSDAVEAPDEGTRFTKAKKRRMLDDLLEETYKRAYSSDATAKDVGAFLDVMARHDLIYGEIVKPKLEVVFPQLDAIFGKTAVEAVEGRLGVKRIALPGETPK